MPIIRSHPTPEQIADAEAAWTPTRTFSSGIRLSPGRAGVVYLLRADNGEYKIGLTIASGERRRRQIETQIKSRTTLLTEIATNATAWAEDWLHQLFAAQQLHGEWFALTQDDVDWLCSLSCLVMRGQGDPRL